MKNGACLVVAVVLVALAPSGLQAQRDPSAPAPQDRFIPSDGRRIHYLDWGGAGKLPLIMLHGIGRSARTYDHIAPHFTSDYHVITVDLRGHGDSEWRPDGAYLVEDYVKDLVALIDQLGLKQVILSGCSIGGRVVQVYAGMHPERVHKAIVEDVGPERPEEVTRSLGQRIQREQEGWASEDELFQSLRRNPTRVPEEMHRHQIRHETRRLPNGRIAWKYDPDVTKGLGPTELWSFVKQITAPTLYVLGGRSTIVPAATQQRLKATLPNIEVVTIPDAGHYPHEDTLEVFVAILKAFLAG